MNREPTTCSITEYSPASIFLTRKIVSLCGEVTTQKRRLILIREYQVSRFELVLLENPRTLCGHSGAPLGTSLLLSKETRSTLDNGCIGSAHLIPTDPKATGPSEPLYMLPSKMTPFSVPEIHDLLHGGEVSIRVIQDPDHCKRLSGLGDVVKGSNHRQ